MQGEAKIASGPFSLRRSRGHHILVVFLEVRFDVLFQLSNRTGMDWDCRRDIEESIICSGRLLGMRVRSADTLPLTGLWCMFAKGGKGGGAVSQNASDALDARIEELRQRLQEIEHASDDDLPLGKANTRRELLIQAAIDAADSILMGFTEGSIEELNYLTSELALKWAEKAAQARRSENAGLDIQSKAS